MCSSSARVLTNRFPWAKAQSENGPWHAGAAFRRSALLLLQLGLFILVLGITMARGLRIDCSCGLFFQRQVGPAAILEDGFLLLLTGLLYWRERGLKFD
jgi:hypothetical protein